MTPYYERDGITIFCGDCLEVMHQIDNNSVDAIITDPPYPHIKRDYGYWTTEEWWELIVEGIIPEVQRILKPTGSAMFILQPNSEHAGQMRGWLWKFMAWVCQEWNMVQDVWWWNYETMPMGGATTMGLLRGSVKACVWMGPAQCYRNQSAVLWRESTANKARSHSDRINNALPERRYSPSGRSVHLLKARRKAREQGGVTPYNLLPFGNDGQRKVRGHCIHGATTPLKLATWWTRYICPPGGTVLDPFNGSGTTGVAAKASNCNFVGIEINEAYCQIAVERLRQRSLWSVVAPEPILQPKQDEMKL